MSKPTHIFQLLLDSNGDVRMDTQLQKTEVWFNVNNNQEGSDNSEHA